MEWSQAIENGAAIRLISMGRSSGAPIMGG
jgi:hypothetical protein